MIADLSANGAARESQGQATKKHRPWIKSKDWVFELLKERNKQQEACRVESKIKVGYSVNRELFMLRPLSTFV